MAVVGAVKNKNFLSPLGYKFSLARAPNLEFNVQSVMFPGVTLGTTDVPTPFLMMPQTGKNKYNPLSITFRVSEDLNDFLEIYNWMIDLGFPVNFDQYKTLKNASHGNKETLRSDLTLTVLTSSLNPNFDITFYDAFPTDLSSMNFTSTDTDINYIEVTATFSYLRYEIIKI